MLWLISMVVTLMLTGYVFYQSYAGRLDLVHTQRLGCERGKLDRADNAAFQNAHKKYIDKVVLAQSVKEDVKRAAREAEKTYVRTAADLTRRSEIDCVKAFPNPGVLP
jgi:hypothetical protein